MLETKACVANGVDQGSACDAPACRRGAVALDYTLKRGKARLAAVGAAGCAISSADLMTHFLDGS